MFEKVHRPALLFTAFFILWAIPPSDAEGVNLTSLESSISDGIEFLHRNQLGHGEFRTYASPDSNMQRILHFDSSPFVTTFVLYSIDFVDDGRVDEMTRKGLDFLSSEEERGGTWRYWTSLNDKRIDPDLDDMSCISFLLRKHGIRFGSNHNIFYRNRNRANLFYTWIRDPDTKNPNDIDCVVNANVLLYLGENPKTRSVCTYLNDIIARNCELQSTVYYIDQAAVYYAISRAFHEGVDCLEASRDSIVTRISAGQEEDGSFGDELSTAFSVCTLLNFGEPDSTVLSNAANYLIKRQRANGSWVNIAFYVAREASIWWGSKEFTTAISVEALARFEQSLGSEKYGDSGADGQ